MKRVIAKLVALAACLVAVLVGVNACSHPPKPRPTPVMSCAGDHDHDCPAGEPGK